MDFWCQDRLASGGSADGGSAGFEDQFSQFALDLVNGTASFSTPTHPEKHPHELADPAMSDREPQQSEQARKNSTLEIICRNIGIGISLEGSEATAVGEEEGEATVKICSPLKMVMRSVEEEFGELVYSASDPPAGPSHGVAHTDGKVSVPAPVAVKSRNQAAASDVLSSVSKVPHAPFKITTGTVVTVRYGPNATC